MAGSESSLTAPTLGKMYAPTPALKHYTGINVYKTVRKETMCT